MKDIKVHWLNTIDSTNAEAMRNKDNSTDMSVWAAMFQTQGRGQRGNKWESGDGLNLTFSILLKPDNLLSVNQFYISQVAALGVVAYLKKNGLSAKIKWPNDIYVGDRKICGILIENILSADKLSASIVGIGINLNQEKFCSDAPNPTSLKLEMLRGRDGVWPSFKPEEELLLFLREFVPLYYQIDTEEKMKMIDEAYHKKLYRLGECSKFQDLSDNSIFEGKILGTDKNARLKIETTSGQIREFAFKEIKYIL